MRGKMTLLVGLPASGKSTWAKEAMAADPKIFRINWDELRVEMGMTVFSRENEQRMKVASENLVRKAVVAGATEIIVDNTNLTQSTRDRWEQIAKELDLQIYKQWFLPEVETCVDRDYYREGKARVGRAVIERMALWNGLIKIPHGSPELGTRDIVILDIDGTIANLEHRRLFLRSNCPVCRGTTMIMDPDYLYTARISCPKCQGTGLGKKDWYKFYQHVVQDVPIPSIIQLAKVLRETGYRILVVSGRPISWGDLEIGKWTEDWLYKHGVLYDHLFMRAGEDSREDTIIKKEILDRLPKDRIAYCLDDRDSVVKMWRDNGLTCLQVAPGDF